MRKAVKSWALGIGTTGLYFVSTSALSTAGQCTGACGSCGFACLGGFVPLAIIGGVALVKKKIKPEKPGSEV